MSSCYLESTMPRITHMFWEPVTVAVWKMARLSGLHCCVCVLREPLYTARGSLANVTISDCADCAG